MLQPDAIDRRRSARQAAPRLLVVDLDPWCRALADGALRAQGYRVVCTGDVATAARVADELEPDLAVVDVTLVEDVPLSQRRSSDRARPEALAGAGYAILRALDIEPSRILRRMVVLRDDAAEWGERSPRFAVLGYIPKPFTPHMLVRQIGAQVEQLSMRAAAASSVTNPERSPSEAALEGDVQHIGIPAILEMLHFNQLTGVCSFQSPGGHSAEVHLFEGEITGALTDDGARDVEAVFRLLGWTDGRFIFRSEPVGENARLPMRFEELMLEGVRRLDESRLFPFPMFIASLRVGQA